MSSILPPRFLPSIFVAHRVQQSRCSSIFHRVLLTHALALFASQFVHEKKSQRIYTSMHSAGLELTKLAYTRPEDNLIRHRGDRLPLRYGHSKPNMVAAPGVGWMASRAVWLVAGWQLLCFCVIHFLSFTVVSLCLHLYF